MNIRFIEFLVRNKSLKFGDFTLKSGRKSPYFINTGVLSNGENSYTLGKFYAEKINEIFGESLEAIYGPAYKGIPLAVSASIAMYKELGKPIGWIFDRKEVKAHGDKGAFVGSNLGEGSGVVIVDDVMTTGGTKVEAIEKIKNSLGAEVKGIVIAVDREEIGKEKGAIEEFSEKTGVPVYSIVKISEVFEYLKDNEVDGEKVVTEEIYKAFLEYKEKYGVK